MNRVCRFFRLLACPLLATPLFLGCGPVGGPQPGQSTPPLAASGWLGGTLPDAGELADQVLVIDCWASW